MKAGRKLLLGGPGVLVLSLLLLGSAAPAFAAGEGEAPTSGFRAEFLFVLGDVEKKAVSLAEAVPQEKYLWQPMEGVRSVSQAYMHLAGANFFFPTLWGFKPPEGMSQNLAAITDKEEVVETLKKSFDHVRQAVLSMSDEDLDKPINLFGREATVRAALLLTSGHMQEHLGQSIAYARSNQVVPPWSESGGN